MPAVRIAGAGCISAFGAGTAALTRGLATQSPSTAPFTRFPLRGIEGIPLCPIDPQAFAPGEHGAKALIRRAVDEALANARFAPQDLHAAALLIGSGSFLFAAEAEYRERLACGGDIATTPLRGTGWMAAQMAADLDIAGPTLTISTACSSSANTLAIAADWIRRGVVDRALVIGAEALSSISLSGFQSLMLLDPDGCRPFDRDRSGLQLGEAVAAIVLEATDDGDGARLLGAANLCDIHHVTGANPDGSAMAAVIDAALRDSGLQARDIAAIKAHGTGSPDNDLAEAAALRRVFGKQLPPFTSFKPYFGHTLGACGALETIALLGCLERGLLAPTLGFNTVDPELGVQPLTTAQTVGPGNYLLNFFGFGGNYAALVLRYD